MVNMKIKFLLLHMMVGLSFQSCGIKNTKGLEGTPTEPIQVSQEGEFPWTVAIFTEGDSVYVGGGSLVHPKVVLTAAHIVHGKWGLVASIGAWNLSSTNERNTLQTITLEKIIIHPQFSRTTMQNNVALLILKSEVVLGDTVMPICLPDSDQVFDGFDCIVTGWGINDPDTGDVQQVMKKVQVPAVNHNECQTMLRNTRLGSSFNLDDSFNCAWGAACVGDGGSPLICPIPNNPNKYVQMGVTSWGIGCGIKGNPDVYGSVPKTVNWIQHVIKEESGTKETQDTSREAKHGCERTCEANDQRTCNYVFNVTEYATMSSACFKCGKGIMSDCTRKDCVPADGVPRIIRVVNRQMPGPAIQVCEGDRLIVRVNNDLLSDSECIHWHGQHQNGSQYMDGVPDITQCPIQAGNDFTYDMPYLNYGTYWYHSHSGLQRGDGVFGAMVVRRIKDPQAHLYDTDLTSHVIVLQDWTHVPMLTKFTDMIELDQGDYPNTILVNGKGRNTMQSDPIAFPYATFNVTQGKRHRFRLICAVSLTCPIMLSIDNHNFTIIATDGNDIIPTPASSLIMYSGERFDIVVDANQTVDNYWIRFNGLLDCTEHMAYQGAILKYIGATLAPPEGALNNNTTPPPGILVNPTEPVGFPINLTMADLKGNNSTDPCLAETTDRQFYLGFEINKINNPRYDPGSLNLLTYTPQLDHISFMFPRTPPLSQPNDKHIFCKYGKKPQCPDDFCSCTYLLEVKMNETVEIILVNEGKLGIAENHPYHLHGYSFYVVAMEKVGSPLNVTHVKSLKIEPNLRNPILKDTVTVPYQSYTVIRFTANNPGWWFMHCHLNFHVNMGMAAVLHVGNRKDLPPKPEHFPHCGKVLDG